MTVTAPQSLIETQQHLAAANQPFVAEHTGGNVWTLVSRRTDGTWALSGEAVLSWYPGISWDSGEDSALMADIDCTTPRNIAAAAAAIISAPADQRAYVAAVEGANLVEA